MKYRLLPLGTQFSSALTPTPTPGFKGHLYREYIQTFRAFVTEIFKAPYIASFSHVLSTCFGKQAG